MDKRSIFNNDTRHIMSAACSNNLQRLVKLVEGGVDVNTKTFSNTTVLMHASMFGHLETVKYLVEHGADLNAKDNLGATALIYAAIDGHVDVVKYLIKQGADLNAKDLDHETYFDKLNDIDKQQIVKYFRSEKISKLLNVIQSKEKSIE